MIKPRREPKTDPVKFMGSCVSSQTRVALPLGLCPTREPIIGVATCLAFLLTEATPFQWLRAKGRTNV